MADSLNATFSSLSDPTRRAILLHLRRGECSVTELARPFRISLPAISKHLRVLERSGLIAPRRQHRWRYYRLEAETLKEAGDWIGEYRQFWEASMDRLGHYLQELQRPNPPATKSKSSARKPTPPSHG